MTRTPLLRLLSLAAVVAVIGAAVYLMMMPGDDRAAIGEGADETAALQRYDNAVFGLSFSYPDGYKLIESDTGSGERKHHVITLVDKAAAAQAPENSEGPVSMSIDIFQNNIDKLPVRSWIQHTSASNFKLSPDQMLATTTVSGADGFAYIWDGLYRGESVAVAHAGDIVMFTVTSLETTDRIRDDYVTLMNTVQFR